MKGYVVFLIVAFAKTALCTRCSGTTQQRCSQEGLAAIEAGNCTSLRENFDCLVFQSSMCLSTDVQDALRPTLQQMYTHLKNNDECASDFEGSSWCYSKSDLNRCGFYNDPTLDDCRSFDEFRNCVSNLVNTECFPSAMKMLYTYFTDRGGENAWKCPTYKFGPMGPTVENEFHILPACKHVDKIQECIIDSSLALESNDCRAIRKQYNCLIWYSTRCLNNETKDSVMPILIQLWDYLETSCEGEESWKEYFCYDKWDVQKCEVENDPTGSCSSFFDFKECVKTTLFIDCYQRDRFVMPTYLTHKGKDNAWNCPNFGKAPAAATRMFPPRAYSVSL